MNRLDGLSQERLKEVLNYNPDTGIFIWKVRSSARVYPGDIASYIEPSGYVSITIDRIRYQAHRLAWLYIYGYFPENCIDHIDRTKNHNCIANLREVSHSCNTKNTDLSTRNTSGIKGVAPIKNKKGWQVHISKFRNQVYLGCFKSFDEAVCTRLAAEQCLNWSGCDSSSTSYKYVKENIQGGVL